MSIAEYQARQIQMNLPSHSLSDDESDTSFVGDQDLTYSVGMIYYSKVNVPIWTAKMQHQMHNLNAPRKTGLTMMNTILLH